jgi:hypothetical protein
MSLNSLEVVSWHDLPVKSITIAESGVELVVMPFVEAEKKYAELQLSLIHIEGLQIDMSGQLSSADLANLEVATFQFSDLGSGYISGQIGFLPGAAGYWRIIFAKAKWQIGAPNNSFKADAVPARP